MPTAADLLDPALAYTPVRIPAASGPDPAGVLAGVEAFATSGEQMLLVVALAGPDGMPVLHIVDPGTAILLGELPDPSGGPAR